MPTPFSHLQFAQRSLRDRTIPKTHLDLLSIQRGAYLLGSVAADARVGSGAPREATHFYVYGQEIREPPWRVMMQRHDELWTPHSDAHRAFVAGYVAHLAMDEYWSLHMVKPNFVEREWVSRSHRFVMLHAILIYMDERDYAVLDDWQADSLNQAEPDRWAAFLPDSDLRSWRDLIYSQICKGGISQTYAIFAPRVRMTEAQLRAVMDTDEKLHDGLWQYVPRASLEEVEQGMYRYAISQLVDYLEESTRRSNQ